MRPPVLAGMLFGVVLSPLLAVLALVMRARVFHRGGTYVAGELLPCASDDEAAERAAQRFSGGALLRLSAGKSPEIRDDLRDVLGLAMRLGKPGAAAPSDQDLIFASFETLGVAGEAVKHTNTADLLANTFYTASLYADPDLGRVRFRLAPHREGKPAFGSSGPERFVAEVRDTQVSLRLAAAAEGEQSWRDIADVVLREPLDLADSDTDFNPWRRGRGVVPDDFVGGVRRVIYPVTRTMRRLRG